MYIAPWSFQALALWSFAVSTAHAQYVVESLSFGHRDNTISPNNRMVPGWQMSGENHRPDLLSDRVILTPPYPGNKRGAIWAQQPLDKPEWVADLSLRASGPERGSGNMQLWYTKEGSRLGQPSLYTTKQFDGLVLVLDQYEGRGGSLRGFLNDGTMSFKDHHNLDSLAFGQCDFAYRNLGRFAPIQVKQTSNSFEVTVDNRPCFKSDKIKLPTGYYFGISAASAENPDSFEIQKFVVSTTNTVTREEVRRQPPIPPPSPQQQQQQQQAPVESLPDSLAESIKSQEAQFADLHNRLQVVNHQVSAIFTELQTLSQKAEERHRELMSRIEQRGATVERIVSAIQKDIEGKDYREHLNSLQSALRDTQSTLSEGLPAAMSSIVSGAAPKLSTFVFVIVAVQIMVYGAYLVYKKRRENAPKKYL